MRSADFSLAALFAALDQQRQRRGLSWATATREINRTGEHVSIHPISPSTITGLRTKAVAEGDGVLQMLLWLDRAPESFMPGAEVNLETVRLPRPPATHVLRFDVPGIHTSINARRTERGISWVDAAREIGLPLSTLTGLARGSRSSFPPVMRITRWLGRPVADFTRASAR